jgi:hypothetical protein
MTVFEVTTNEQQGTRETSTADPVPLYEASNPGGVFLAGGRRPSAGSGRCTASARAASAGTGFRSYCRRAFHFGYLWASHASRVAQKA